MRVSLIYVCINLLLREYLSHAVFENSDDSRENVWMIRQPESETSFECVSR